MAFAPTLGHTCMEKAGMEFLQQTDWQPPNAESLADVVKSEGTEQRLLQLCHNLQCRFFFPRKNLAP